jgi:hypothetical protein
MTKPMRHLFLGSVYFFQCLKCRRFTCLSGEVFPKPQLRCFAFFLASPVRFSLSPSSPDHLIALHPPIVLPFTHCLRLRLSPFLRPPPPHLPFRRLLRHTQAIARASVQVELGALQLENLELLKRHGANAWQLHNREAEAAEKGCVLCFECFLLRVSQLFYILCSHCSTIFSQCTRTAFNQCFV